MSNYLLFNGEFHAKEEALLTVANRSYSYGDGFFESIRISNGKMPLAKVHWQRILRTCAFLRIQVPVSFSERNFIQLAIALAKKNGFRNARVRFQGYRKGAGRYTPESNVLGWSMVCEQLEEDAYQLNKKGLRVEVCTTHRINPAPQSSFKSSNSLPYVLGGMFVSDNKLDDCFLLDSEGFIAETTGSNVFLLKGNQLVTPDLSRGGVSGVMRSVVLREAAHLGLTTSTELVLPEDVLEADECFLTNATRGIQWVGAVGKKRFYKRCAEKLNAHINLAYGFSPT